jgi:hypothetical protein
MLTTVTGGLQICKFIVQEVNYFSYHLVTLHNRHANVNFFLLLLLLLRWLYSPMRTFASLMDFSQSSLQSI